VMAGAARLGERSVEVEGLLKPMAAFNVIG
jgi:hypothetical protein